MPFNAEQFTEGRLRERLGQEPPRRLVPQGGYDLPSANLARLRLTHAALAQANLAGADLRDCDLAGADLTGADLTGADLSGALLTGAVLNDANLRGAVLRRAVLNGTRVAGCHLAGAVLDGARLADVALWTTDLAPADLAPAAVHLRSLQLLERTEGTEALPWCVAFGDDATRTALRALLKHRAWRGRQLAVREAIAALDIRLGALTDASLSRVRRGELNDRSVSPAEGSALDQLRRRREDDGPSDDPALRG